MRAFMQRRVASCYSSSNSALLIEAEIASRYGSKMDVREARKRNLSDLLAQYKTQRVFADATGLVASHVSQMKNGTRRMGDDVARRIETALGLPHGFLDHPPAPNIDGPNFLTSSATAHWKDTSKHPSQALEPPGGEPLNRKQQVLLDLFAGLTNAQQGDLIRELEEKKRLNEELLDQLLSRKRASNGDD